MTESKRLPEVGAGFSEIPVVEAEVAKSKQELSKVPMYGLFANLRR